MKYLILVITSIAILPFQQLIGEDLIIKPGTKEWRQSYEPDATKPVEIQPSNPLRKILLNLARPRIEKKAGKPILFNGSLKGYRNWALLEASVEDKNGRAIDFDEYSSDSAVALFLKTINGWVLVDSSAGGTDYFYPVWVELYGMPKELLSY